MDKLGRMIEPGKLGPVSRVSWPNAVTAVRLALALVVAASIASGMTIGLWGIAAAALALDGVDGWLARKLGQASAFGARFDMETDALFVMILSLHVWWSGAAGAWVLLIGAMRYLFVAAGQFWPALRGELRPSLARKTTCVIQVVSLLIGSFPGMPSIVSGPVLAAALLLLLWSFARDVGWLLSQAR
ncbi:MAG: CDP-alcohol phosphatidyltransferase family protein [Myxococcota bacterium]